MVGRDRILRVSTGQPLPVSDAGVRERFRNVPEGSAGGFVGTVFERAQAPAAAYPSGIPFVPDTEITALVGDGSASPFQVVFYRPPNPDAAFRSLVEQLTRDGWAVAGLPPTPASARGALLTRRDERWTLLLSPDSHQYRTIWLLCAPSPRILAAEGPA